MAIRPVGLLYGAPHQFDWIIEEKGVGFKSIQDGAIDTTTSGELMFNIFGALAQFERRLIQERNNAVLNARARGRLGGRPKVKPSN